MNLEDDDVFLQAFQDCTLPTAAFDHRHHLRLALLNWQRHGDAGARYTSDAIRHYATVHGAASKFKEPLTQAWCQLVRAAAIQHPEAKTIDDLIERAPHLMNRKACD